jgi:type 2 lantibiotic biosynthesis protein LanM
LAATIKARWICEEAHQQMKEELGLEYHHLPSAKRMDPFHEHLIVRAATIDELLSPDFETLPGQKGDAGKAAHRIAAWCRVCASGDWSLFNRRLERDALTIEQVLARFATARRKVSVPPPTWIGDAVWIEAALQSTGANAEPAALRGQAEPCAFEHLFAPVLEEADRRLSASVDATAFEHLTDSARGCLRALLLAELSGLFAAPLYERFAQARKAGETPADASQPPRDGATVRYQKFVTDMRAGGFRRLFEQKPVLLRLAATIVRQWIEASAELHACLNADLPTIRRDILGRDGGGPVVAIEGDLSDPHNGGRSVRILRFEDGARVVYKPKDLRLDVAWHGLVERLNRDGAPIELKAVRVVARDGYGWTEFIMHAGCGDADGCQRFFRRAGAWLALFHCFAGSDMHQENMIAAADHPVPIDLETLLQAAAEEQGPREPAGEAFAAALEIIANSVVSIGLLPTFAKSPENTVFAIGGMAPDWASRMKLTWSNINSDAMRPIKSKEAGDAIPNLPHVDGRYAELGDHVEDVIAGFADYANFLLRRSRDEHQGGLFDAFSGFPVRRIVRPTRFYYMLLLRLRDHRSMGDGVAWSAQADFLARLSEWESDSDPLWPLQRAERMALLDLNVPYFVSPNDEGEISDATGISVRTQLPPGLARARARLRSFDAQDIAWQIEVIKQNTSAVSRSSGPVFEKRPLLRARTDVTPAKERLVAEADRIADELARLAVRRGSSAAWIGLDWLGDSEVWHLVPLGPDLYNGMSGIAVFLAAHTAVTGFKPSAELARAAVLHLRMKLKARHSARTARSLGLGGCTGLGSVIYAMTVMAKCLNDDDLLADARAAAELFSEDLIAADKHLDVMGGSAGGILALLRLYRDTQSDDVLARATRCGDHLLAQPRVGPVGRRSWCPQGTGQDALNGMSHGAAGFAYALASLSAATGGEEFARAAEECIAFENASYDEVHSNWPDLRIDAKVWPSQWCHGACGIGLARVGMSKCRGEHSALLADVRNALAGVERVWPGYVDTLCCGTLGNIEFLFEAADVIGRSELRELALGRLMLVLETARANRDYRWNIGHSRYNLGLFRGLAGVGYTCLRRVHDALPNVLVWE